MKDVSAWRKRQAAAGHLRQVGPIAPQQVFHLSRTFNLAVAKKIYVSTAFPIVAR